MDMSVLQEGTAYHGRAPRISQMTSGLLRHTAAAMRAHNVLCNSYLCHTAAAMRAHNVLCNSYYITVIKE
jgi:23S rRNA maturation-related 3'-5' exoribonuclease YhaM